MNKIIISTSAAFAAFLSFSSAAHAEGSTWGALETSPSEDNNVIGTLYVEQSHPVWTNEKLTLKLSPFINGTLVADSKGYNWNNKVTAKAGVKLDYLVGEAGVLTLRTGAASSHQFKSGSTDTEPFLSAEYWFGWGNDTSTPGSSWGIVGNTSPSEKGNVIAMAHLEQGFLARQVGIGKVVPFVDLSITRDTKDNPWNNKEVYGLGVKYSLPVSTGSVDFRAKFQHERRDSTTDNGVAASVSYWFKL